MEREREARERNDGKTVEGCSWGKSGLVLVVESLRARTSNKASSSWERLNLRYGSACVPWVLQPVLKTTRTYQDLRCSLGRSNLALFPAQRAAAAARGH